MADDADTELTTESHSEEGTLPRGRRTAVAVGALAAVALAGMSAWLGWQVNQSREQLHERDLYLQAARQVALNLTTIDYRHADTDIQRILDGTAGAFHDDFKQRSQPFVETVKQAQSTSEGSITAAGLESVSDREAQALIAVMVKSSLGGVEQPQPRAWRMRVNVQHLGNEVKVSNVEFVA